MPVLYFVRHGETDFNVEQRLQGRTDTSLNANGRRQAGELRAYCAICSRATSFGPAIIAYVRSPLKRARETMEILRAALGLDPTAYDVDGRLMEISYGEWEGTDAGGNPGARTGSARNGANATNGISRRPAAKSYRDVAKRVGEWYATVSRDTVVAAHGGVARVLMANFHILPEDEATHAEIAARRRLRFLRRAR